MLTHSEALVLRVAEATGEDATALQKLFEEAGRQERSFFSRLVDRELIEEEACYKIWAEALGMNFHGLSSRELSPSFLHRLPLQIGRRYGAIAIDEGDDWIEVVLFHPFDKEAQATIARVTNKAVRPAISSPQAIQVALARQAKGRSGIEGLLASFDSEGGKNEAFANADALKQLTGSDAVIQLVDYLLEEALRQKASDIHLETTGNRLRCRYRIDGELETVHRFPWDMQAPLVSRIKVMSGLDISEKRKPQDGRFVQEGESGAVEFRVSILPTVNGEKIVMRILDKAGALLGLEQIGFGEKNLASFRKGIHCPNGLVLITGPTGSGKTTSLYAALSEINEDRINIITVEDPVEYELLGTAQVQVDPKAGRTFAGSLRSILRQDPDVVMVGEIRDAETATIAIQAALTGHRVFSTLHTNDAIGAVYRLLDMGIEPYLLGPALRCVTAQRLVPRVCPHCSAPHDVEEHILEALHWPESLSRSGIRLGAGCELCRGKGRLGRIALHEVLYLDNLLQGAVTKAVEDDEFLGMARQSGYCSLLVDGLKKAMQGLIVPEDLLGIVRID